MEQVFLHLVRLGIGRRSDAQIGNEDWNQIKALAERQGLSAIIVDGIERLPESQRPPKGILLEWIGSVMQDEARYSIQNAAANIMASLFQKNCIQTYVLKGDVISECYPKPEHRVSVDLDCFLKPIQGDLDAWSLGNDLIKTEGYEVKFDYYKNSTFILPGLTVENHRYFTPFRGNNKLRALEKVLQSMISDDGGQDKFEGTSLNRPPVMLTALFLIEHAYSHFLHEGLTWRHVLDWVMFSQKHNDKIDWYALDAMKDEFGFRKFYDTYSRLGKYLIGELSEDELTRNDRIMLQDVWGPLDLHETVRGIKGKLALVGNTLRARWKYRYFSDISMLQALWIQVKGFLFIKEPKLG